MTAALQHEVVTLVPTRDLRLVHDTSPVPAPAPKKATGPAVAGHFGAGDPLVDGAARLLSVPVRHVYAALWRVGLIDVVKA
ncbi:Mycobacterium rhizamassiliense ORFan [Mycobacterium rhizamassiliense]|uniref:Mycobacterium rhizamassiliense ORFan n=1 Tax=Mycobacterium rhizamassiliense TaxID=1841860 RepID=A0A2U3NZY8_9MYCO|nr:Rv1535 family protein [Mycobacterium rhizamassiliense]SPM37056.1 Mycobacterium rhizamassiliense ORFan [Mycobacterium rhizamassiliense]